jgi:hypothetical protein
LLRLSAFLTEFDFSGNDLGECAAAVLGAALCVLRLCALQLENCGVGDSCAGAISRLVRGSRTLQTLELTLADLSAAPQRRLAEDLSGNVFPTAVSLSRGLEPTARAASARNSCAAQLVDGLAHIPFTPGLRCKINSYKSVKGRQMVGRAPPRAHPRIRRLRAGSRARGPRRR